MAKTVPVEKLIALFQKMYKEHWPYVWGAAREGCVDCSGAFDYAFDTFGINYPHGSNAIARSYTVGGLLPISKAKPGMAAFKAKSPGESGYDLKDKYKPGGSAYNGDLLDYSHIGLVDTDSKFVLNAKGEKYGFCRDQLTTRNGWDYVAELKYVDYGEKKEDDTMEARVSLPTGASGSTVNMRKAANKASAVLKKVPVGSVVDVISDQGQWCEIEYEGTVGYMMSNYLEYVGQDGESEVVALDADKLEQINAALRAIDNASDLISSIVGRG